LSSGVLLASVTVFCLWRVRRQPCLFVGWFWFLVMLVPVIGLVQVGKQSMADRYTYLPSIGLFIMLAWGMAGIASRSKHWRTAMILGAVGLVLACLPGIRRQLDYWQDDVKLFSHSIDVTPEDNYQGYLLLGNALVESGNLEAAVRNYQTSLQIAPDELIHLEEAHYNLGCVLSSQKKFQEAEVQFGEALRLNDNNADAHAGLGNVMTVQKKYAEARAEYANARRLKPDDASIRKALAVATVMAESETALTNFYETLKVKPSSEAHVQIAAILIIQGNYQDAAEHYHAALQLQPDAPDVLNNLAWLLSACPDDRVRNGVQAVQYAERACELTHHGLARAVGTLAAAYAEAGRFDDAISTAQKACALAEKSGDQALLQKNQELLKLYRAHQPYREPTEKLVPAAP
jgi:tetratricopeptide (TPR) repeat protein